MLVKPKVICVLSAPRSGSSALCRMLEALGMSFGPGSGLVSPDRFNRHGYYELQELLGINEQILSETVPLKLSDVLEDQGYGERDSLAIESRYWAAASSPVSSEHSVSRELESRIENVIKGLDSAQKLPVLKDARLSLTLPVWKNYCTPIPIILWRHPEQVSNSLERMTGLPKKYGEWIWLNYTRSAFEVCTDREPLVISHSELVDKPAETANRLFEYLGRFSKLDSDRLDSAGDIIDKSAITHFSLKAPEIPSIASYLSWLEKKDYSNLPKIMDPLINMELLPFVVTTRDLYKRLKSIAITNKAANDLEKIRRLPGYRIIRSIYRLFRRI